MTVLYHGTLASNLQAILKDGIREGEGWGGANTAGVFLSGHPRGALYWAKMAYQRNHEGKLEAHRFDRDHGHEADRLLVVLAIEIPEKETKRLKADEEQFEDVGASFSPSDWKRSLVEIGDVRFEGVVPPKWIKQVIMPSEIEVRT